MNRHDYAGCQREPCRECAARARRAHAPDCGCQPCLVVKVSRGVSERESAAGRTRAAKGTAERHQP